MKVVFDAGVVFSGAGWRGEAHLCLVAMSRRRVIAFATSQTRDHHPEGIAQPTCQAGLNAEGAKGV